MAGKASSASKALTAPPNRAGRKSSYRPDYADQARKLCLLGATDAELADFFSVSETTINNWKNEHAGFLESIRAGKITADANVADSLYRRATGEHVQVEKLVKRDDGSFEAMRFQQYLPGDPTAAYKWLLNRRRQDWTDSSKIDLSGSITVVIEKPA